VDNQEIEYSRLSWNRVSDRPDGFLCSEIYFSVGEKPDLGEIELVIGQLETEVIEYDCTKAQKKLDEAKIDVIVECYEDPTKHFGIEKWPKNIREEEIFDLIDIVEDAFSDIIQGPWIFVFEVHEL
jgi:hypothetical protein